MIKSFLIQVIKLKRIFFFSWFIFFQNEVISQKFFSYYTSAECNSVTDTFYFEIGTIKNKEFNPVDIRKRTASGFFRGSGDNMFLTDTLFYVVTLGNDWFRNTLDSMNIVYSSYNHIGSFMDSLYYLYRRKNKIEIKYSENKNKKKRKMSFVFIKIKARITYNNSFIKQYYIDETYRFNNRKKLIDSPNKFIVYKPILNICILE